MNWKSSLNENSKRALITAAIGMLTIIVGIFAIINRIDTSTGGSLPRYQVLPTSEINLINGDNVHKFKVEIADNREEQRTGLMFREYLGEKEGMLFVFGTEQNLNFWMKDTYIPLDILFFDSNKKLINTHKQTMPFQEYPGYPSAKPAKYALELRAGTFDMLGLNSELKFEFVQ